MALLDVRDLWVTFLGHGRRDVRAVDGVSFAVEAGSTVGIVGESGSGKSVTSLAALGLLPARGVRVGGTAHFDGRNLLSMDDEALRDLRGRDVTMVFQDPLSSLNPVLTAGRQNTEVLERHRGLSAGAARADRRRPGCGGSVSRTPPPGWPTIPTSCPAGCASGS